MTGKIPLSAVPVKPPPANTIAAAVATALPLSICRFVRNVCATSHATGVRARRLTATSRASVPGRCRHL